MPEMIQGFNQDGEMKWFQGSGLPEGWSATDPKAENSPASPKDLTVLTQEEIMSYAE